MSRHRPLLMLRWLALGAAGGVALVLGLDRFGLAGPWQALALLLALLAVFAIGIWLYANHEREHDLDETSERARHGQQLIDQLQHEIDRHTRLEKELMIAKQAAESAVMAKGEFLATMSHEIRTPLNGIVPMLDLLLQTPLSEAQVEMLRTAYSSSQQLLRIVDDILDYSKLEADRLELETTGFNLRELLENVIRLMERSAESKGLRLYLHIDPGVRLPVRGDPVRLRQIVTNLISNAVKFTEKGSVSVHVRRLGESAAQHQLRFEVRDTGIGIAPETMARLFTAFSQADASTTRLYGGTGLGLAICKRIVELMGGRIGVDSEPGRGAEFWFEIPLLKVHGDMPAQDASHSGMRVMLLSNDPRLRMRMSMLLPNWGMRLTAVETTQEALDRLRAASTQGPPWAYSVVVADLSGMRNTAVALRRNLEHHAIYGDVRLLCLFGDETVPEELRERAILLGRQAQDADLRVALNAPPPAAKAEPAEVVAASTDPGEDRRMRVLLVEDNPVNLMVGQRLLGVLGVDCDTATNGEEALQRISVSRYDLVLMDCQMPVMDGYTATRRWREQEREAGDGRHLPVIAMTANAMAGDRQKCLDAGMDDYLAKPVTRAELERSLQRWWLAGSGPRTLYATSEPNIETPAVAVPVAPAVPPPVAVAVAPVPPPVREPATKMEVNAGSIDDEVLEELRAVLGGELDRLIRVFLDDAPRQIAALEAAAAVPDFEALREHAHSLKSASANLGAMQLSAAAKRIELGARTGTLDRPAVEVAKIDWEFKRARDVLLEVLPRAEA